VPKYLLDTNILSEVVKKRPSPTVLRHLRDLKQSTSVGSSPALPAWMPRLLRSVLMSRPCGENASGNRTN